MPNTRGEVSWHFWSMLMSFTYSLELGYSQGNSISWNLLPGFYLDDTKGLLHLYPRYRRIIIETGHMIHYIQQDTEVSPRGAVFWAGILQKRTSHVGFESKYYPSHYMYIYIYTHIFCSPTKFALTYLLVILLNALLRTKKASMSQQEAETNHDPGTWKQWGFHDGLMSMVGVEQCIGEILLMVQKSCKNHLGWC